MLEFKNKNNLYTINFEIEEGFFVDDLLLLNKFESLNNTLNIDNMNIDFDITINFPNPPYQSIFIINDKEIYDNFKNMLQNINSLSLDYHNDDEKYYLTESFMEKRYAFAEIVNSPNIPLLEKIIQCKELITYFDFLLDENKIPDEMKRVEASFTTFLELLDVLADRINNIYVEALQKYEIEEDKIFSTMINKFIRKVEKELKIYDKNTKLAKKNSSQIKLKKKEVLEYREKLKDENINKYEEIEILYKLCCATNIDDSEKSEANEKLHKAINEYCFSLLCNRFIKKIDEQVMLFNEQYFDMSKDYIAENMLDSANEWAESNPLFTEKINKDEFRNSLKISSFALHFHEVQEGLDITMEIYFTETKNIFASHNVYVMIENGIITQTSLMG